MKVQCNNCHSEIPVSDVDLQSRIAKCVKCNNIFDCSNQISSIESSAKKYREKVEMPKQIRMHNDFSKLLIERKWFSAAVVAMTFFCVFWDGFMIVWYSIAISQKQWGMAAFGTIHALVGIGITYFVIAGYINKTFIRVTKNELDIVHKPLPFGRNKKFSSRDLAQLYSKRNVHHGKNGVHYSYDVLAKTHQGKDLKLIKNLPDPEQALFIEQEIEKFLYIEDKEVPGEL